jgi:hypothetical protein
MSPPPLGDPYRPSLEIVVKLRGRVLVLALLDPEDDALLGEASHEDIHIALALAHPAVDVSGPERRVFAGCSRHQEVLLGGGERFDPAIVEGQNRGLLVAMSADRSWP